MWKMYFIKIFWLIVSLVLFVYRRLRTIFVRLYGKVFHIYEPTSTHDSIANYIFNKMSYQLKLLENKYGQDDNYSHCLLVSGQNPNILEEQVHEKLEETRRDAYALFDEINRKCKIPERLLIEAMLFEDWLSKRNNRLLKVDARVLRTIFPDMSLKFAK
ncbi:uncharacterized protein LOC119679839 [Teleopsis dalmanni]|uniref:uncharacterized protein LOC119679839 n=1 Tax=Teleopsis dalmanni TaxID=139649 RepID=UPI0018CED8DA|nr:uncharacterized protein LOC119679839 [Teleopsis dalmanni]